jgi:hypothetical protein
LSSNFFSDYELKAENIYLKFSLSGNKTHNNFSQECLTGDDLKLELFIHTIPNDTKLYDKYLKLEWRKDGKRLTETKQFLIRRNNSIASLTITNVKYNNTGVYELFGQYFNLINYSFSFDVIVNNLTNYYRYKQSIVNQLNGKNKSILEIISFKSLEN